MIPRNTTIPHSAVGSFVTNSNNQQRVHVFVLEGEVSDPNACTAIGDFRVTGLPDNLPAGSPVELKYSYDANGRIRASAVDVTGNNAAEVEIVRDSGLDDFGMAAFVTLAKEYRVE